ncbi:MAG TPA: hypothetical protein VGH29_02315 [Candidatus Binataceae bacterium]
MGRRVIGLALLYALIVVMAPSDADGATVSRAPRLFSSSSESGRDSVAGAKIVAAQRQLAWACISQVG